MHTFGASAPLKELQKKFGFTPGEVVAAAKEQVAQPRGVDHRSHAISRDGYDAVLFDMDGVVTDTAGIHVASWKKMFDEYLQKRADRDGLPFRPFDSATDYRLYVDGKPRYEGVRDFLRSRGIVLPDGTPDDPASAETIHGLGNRKNALVNEEIASAVVQAYPGTVAFIKHVREAGFKTGVVTSSQHCREVLQAAKVSDLFDVQIDGNTLIELGLAGKPAPDSFLKAAELLGVPPQRVVVIEDAIPGVSAGAQGGFGLVIGVDRKGIAAELKAHGASMVVHDLAELLV
jgi:beta-phosphoglucomutase family hydrolase